MLEKEWLKFFKKNIYNLNKRSEKILNKNYKILRNMLISRNDIEWVEPEKGSSVCVLKFGGIQDIKRFRELLEENDIRLAISDEGLVRMGLGGNTRMFKKGIIKLNNLLDKKKSI